SRHYSRGHYSSFSRNLCLLLCQKNNIRDTRKIKKGEFKNAIIKSLLPLGLPVVIIGGILTGVFTATESAAVATIYAFVLCRYIYRELSWAGIKAALSNTVLNTGAIMVLIAVSTSFAWILTKARATQKLLDLFLNITDSSIGILLLMILLLLVLGIILEATPIVLITTPILMPFTMDIALDSISFGVLLSMNLAIESNTRPIAFSLFI